MVCGVVWCVKFHKQLWFQLFLLTADQPLSLRELPVIRTGPQRSREVLLERLPRVLSVGSGKITEIRATLSGPTRNVSDTRRKQCGLNIRSYGPGATHSEVMCMRRDGRQFGFAMA